MSFLYGILRQHFAQRGPFVRAFEAHAGLYGHGDGAVFEYVVQKSLEIHAVPEKSRALALGGYRARGTAHVQVYLVISHIRQHFGNLHKMVGIFGQHLWRHGNAGVFLRRNGALFTVGQVHFLCGAYERYEIFCHPGKTGVMYAPVNDVGDALQGCEIYVHGFSPLRQSMAR